MENGKTPRKGAAGNGYIDMFIDFQGISNARELGGIKAPDGRRVKDGVLLRTAELDRVSPADMTKLTGRYAVRHVVDFRDSSEKERKPDLEIAGAKYCHIPVLPDLPYKSRAIDLTPREVFEQFMLMYRVMAGDEFCVRAWARFFRVLLEAKGETVLWHCVQGKDRTGIAALLLLTALGVSPDDAREDYFLTNVSLGREYEQLEKNGTDERELAFMKVVLYVFPECLEEFLSSVRRMYGDLDGYLRKAIGLTDTDIGLLRVYYTQ